MWFVRVCVTRMSLSSSFGGHPFVRVRIAIATPPARLADCERVDNHLSRERARGVLAHRHRLEALIGAPLGLLRANKLEQMQCTYCKARDEPNEARNAPLEPIEWIQYCCVECRRYCTLLMYSPKVAKPAWGGRMARGRVRAPSAPAPRASSTNALTRAPSRRGERATASRSRSPKWAMHSWVVEHTWAPPTGTDRTALPRSKQAHNEPIISVSTKRLYANDKLRVWWYIMMNDDFAQTYDEKTYIVEYCTSVQYSTV